MQIYKQSRSRAAVTRWPLDYPLRRVAPLKPTIRRLRRDFQEEHILFLFRSGERPHLSISSRSLALHTARSSA